MAQFPGKMTQYHVLTLTEEERFIMREALALLEAATSAVAVTLGRATEEGAKGYDTARMAHRPVQELLVKLDMLGGRRE